MAKLTLNIEALEVQSFATDSEHAGTGTVNAFSGRPPGLSKVSCPAWECNTLEETCPDTCDLVCTVESYGETCETRACACASGYETCVC